MGNWRTILWGLFALGIVAAALFLWPAAVTEMGEVEPGSSIASEGGDGKVSPAVAGDDEPAQTVTPAVEAGENRASRATAQAIDEDVATQAAAAATPEALSLADQTAEERLFQDAQVLDSDEAQIGFSNRVVRRTLYRTSFKYPILLKRQTVEIGPNGGESILSEELMVGDHVMVQLAEGMDEAVFEAWAAERGYAVRQRLRTAPIVLLASEDPDVSTVETLQSDLSVYVQTVGQEPLTPVVEPDFVNFPTVIPDDPSFSDLWGLHNTGQSGGVADADIDAPEAWDITTDASDVLVAVIDTGVDRVHPDLSANMWTNPLEIPGNGIDDDNNGFIDDVHGWDFYDDDNDPTDGGSHGTHCAGTIGAVGGNGAGVVGVCWDVSMVGIRFLGPTGGTTSGAIESVNYATLINADLTSNSWGGGGFNSLLLQAIEDGGASDILFVAAAGNESVDNDVNPHYPSSYGSDSIISVAASDRNDGIASFSNWGRTSVDLAAPGVSIYSTVPNASYGSKSGTSMATPQVSGAVALLRSIAPQLPHLDLKQQLLQSVDPVPAFSQNTVTGGRMNLHATMVQLGGASLRVSQLEVRDDAVGNDNGIINPGEPIDIQFNVSNHGTEPAENVTATLVRELSSVFSGGTNLIPLGTIAPGQTSPILSSFRITADAQTATPHQETVTVRLEWGPSPRVARDVLVPLTVSTSSQISGTITSAGDGSPISGATVTYSGPVTGTVTTDSSGNYLIEVIDGIYTLSAGAATFADSAPRAVTVPPGQAGIDFSLGRPELQVTPPSFSLNLFSGQSATRSMTLTNTGDSTLNWSLSSIRASSVQELPEISTTSRDPDALGGTGEDVWLPAITMQAADLTGTRIGIISTWSYATFEGDLTQRGAQVTNGLTFPLSANQLDDYDVILIDDEIAGANSSDIDSVRSWVSSGGGLLLIGDNADSVPNMNSVLSGTGIQEVNRGGFDTFTVTDIEAHPTTADVQSVYASQSGTFLTVTQNAVELMREPDGVVHAAVANLGSGNVVAVGNELTSTASLNTGDTRLFANQLVDWLNLGFSWLTVSPESGTLAPGASTSATLEVDASGLVTGAYSQNVVIVSNDPFAPQITVPVNLSVTGAPLLSVVQPEIIFPDTALGQTSVETITLQNVGTDQLSIDSLSSSDARFSTTEALPILIEPDSEIDISVQFSPTMASLTVGTLTIGSNDPANSSVAVPLSGQGFTAPVIGGQITQLTDGTPIQNATITYTGPTSGSVTTGGDGRYSFAGLAGTYTLTAAAGGFTSDPQAVTIPPDRLDVDFALGSPQVEVDPTSVSLTLPSGDVATRTVTIRNLGNVSLNWSSRLSQAAGLSITELPTTETLGENPDGPETGAEAVLIPSAEAALSDLTGLSIGMFSSSSVYSTFRDDLVLRGAQVDSGLSFPITSADLQSINVLVIDDAMTLASTADVNVLRQWVSAGGGLFLMGDNSGSIAQNNALLNGTGIQETYRGSFVAVLMSDIGTHPTTSGVTAVYGDAAGAYCTISGDAVYLAQDDASRVHAAASRLGAGRVVAAGDEIPLNINLSTAETRQFANQIIDWLSFAANFDWLTVNPSSGTLSAGQQADVSLEFDASGLVAGSYTADWIIESNDADTPQITVPVALQVSDAPGIEVSPPQLTFPEIYTGQSASLPFTIRNTGSESLSISSLSFPGPQFSTARTLPIVIAPGGSSVVDVLFSPDSGAVFSGPLAISSNDPSNGTVNVGLAGTGVLAPAMSLTPSALNLVIPVGESVTRSVEIGNLGGADLDWTASVGEATDLTPIYQVDWDGSPHLVGQTSAVGGPHAPSSLVGSPIVRQSAGSMANRPVELVGGTGGTFNYGQLHFDMGDRTDKVIVEFDLQKLDSDDLTLFFDVPTVHRAEFYDTHISFSGMTIPYDSSAVNRIRIEYEIDTMTTSLSLNGAAPVVRTISLTNATALRKIRISASDQGAIGGTLIDNLTIGTQSTTPPPPVSGNTLFDVDWDSSPHVVGQTTAVGGTRAPTRVVFGSPTVRQSAGGMPNRPLEMIGGSGGSLNYGQLEFEMGNRTERVVVEFDLQKLDSDIFNFFFDTPQVRTYTFSSTSIQYSGTSVNYDGSVVNRIRIVFHLATLTTSLSVNGSTPISSSISSSGVTGLRSIRLSANDQGLAGGTLIDNLTIVAEGPGGTEISGDSTSWLSMNPLSGTVAPGQSETAQVSINTGSLVIGNHNSTITFQSNDPQRPEIAMPVLISVVGVLEIEVESPISSPLIDGISTVSFPDIIGTASTATRQVRIRNVGTGALASLTAAIDGGAAGDFFISAGSLPALGLAAGQSTTLDVTFRPTLIGERNAVLRIGSNDTDENPFDIALEGTVIPAVPEIEVRTPNGTVLTDEVSELLFPEVYGPGSRSNSILVIRNMGNSRLSELAATIDGPDAAMFTAEGFTATALDPGHSTTLRLAFHPDQLGERVAMLHITSNDVDERSFDIVVKGTANVAQTTLQGWAGSYGLAAAAALSAADNDGDAISLLQEYAFNLDPTSGDSQRTFIPGSSESGLPLIRLVGGRLQIEYVRRETDANLTYRVLFGSELSDDAPEGLTEATEAETVTPIDSDWSRVIINDSETTATRTKRFGTVVVELADP